jgi:copper(I)-binding protein
MTKLVSLLAALTFVGSAAAALAHDYTAGPLKIGHPWTRATPAGAAVAGGYLTLQNTGSAPDRLIGGSAEIAGHVEIHEMAVKDGVMTMRPLDKGLEVSAGTSVELKPGSYHVMFMDLKRQLKEGESVKGTLTFEKAGTVPVEFSVQSIGAREPSHSH